MQAILFEGAVVGFAHPTYVPPTGYQLAPFADGVTEADDMAAMVFDGQVVRVDAAAKLAHAKASRIAAIKAEAASYLDASSWKLERASEREQAGWVQVADVAAVLAERESVRRSSNSAEDAVLALTDLAAVQAYTWQPDAVAVAVPRLLTHEQFIKRFTEAEWQAMTEAARANAAMNAWMLRFSMATVINLDDLSTQAGVQALELAGLLAMGRAAQVLA